MAISTNDQRFEMKSERLFLGDNQFFGINHMSEERAQAQAMRFRNVESIMRVVDDAYDEGLRTLMCTTHDRMREIANVVRTDPSRYESWKWFPCMPYAHKYADAVTEGGYLGALKRFVPQNAFSNIVRGGVSVARQDIEGLIHLLIDAEMTMFDGLSTPAVFLQNVVVDLLLGLGALEPLVMFDEYVRETYHAEPGYITMNLPMFLDAAEKVGLDRPLVCCNINKLGFRMSGGIDAYRECLMERRMQCVAMSVFASGALPADEAIEWVCSQAGVQSIVFGASSRENIRKTRELVGKWWSV